MFGIQKSEKQEDSFEDCTLPTCSRRNLFLRSRSFFLICSRSDRTILLRRTQIGFPLTVTFIDIFFQSFVHPCDLIAMNKLRQLHFSSQIWIDVNGHSQPSNRYVHPPSASTTAARRGPKHKPEGRDKGPPWNSPADFDFLNFFIGLCRCSSH